LKPKNRITQVPKAEPETPKAESKMFLFAEHPEGGLEFKFSGFPQTQAGRDECWGWFDRLIKKETLDRIVLMQAREQAKKNGE